MLVVLTVRAADPRGQAKPAAAVTDDPSVYRMGLSALSPVSVAALVRTELESAASAPARCGHGGTDLARRARPRGHRALALAGIPPGRPGRGCAQLVSAARKLAAS
jgi:hypothetical protein